MKLTQSFIRVEQPLVALQTLYTFPVLVNQAPVLNTEQRLNLQDSFVISELGVYLAAPTSATDTAFRLLSFTNFFSFAANTVPYYGLYNGRLIISVNNNIILPAWDLWRHYCANQTQQGAAVAAAVPQDQFAGERDGMYAVEPNVTLIGSKNYVVQIQLPVGLSAITANSRVVIMMRGILAQNSTVVS
jgi:hypothetical protein